MRHIITEISYHVPRNSSEDTLMTKDVFAAFELDPRLRLGLDGLGMTEPTEVQSAVLPDALKGSDLRVSAETGSGKTMAYLLPAAQDILANPPSRDESTLAVVLVPTRELARQVLKVARSLLAKSPLQVDALTGGADFKYQQAMLRKNPEILVATPGRLLEHCKRRSADLSDVRTLVLDEADRMLELGFREDVLALAENASGRKQTLMLSATLGYRGLGALGKSLLSDPVTVETGDSGRAHKNIFHQRILADGPEHKDRLLVALLNAGGFNRALVFANKRQTAQRLSGLLTHHEFRAGVLHGELSTEARKAVVARFADNKLDILCASDVAARGLDIPDIDLVINYDVPYSGDDYIHRTGRTGRAGATGLAVSLVGAAEWNRMIGIQRYLSLALEARDLPGLKARYSGPRKQKSSGKAAGSAKRKKQPAKKKVRARDRKAKGRPRRSGSGNDGFAPLTRKKPDSDQ